MRNFEIGRARGRSLLAVFSLLATAVVALPALASHGPLASLPGSNFEIDQDANLETDHASPSIDWDSVNEDRQSDAPTGRGDDSFAGGAKEDDLCPGTTTGSIPNNKSDLLTFGLYEEPGDPGFLHLFWTRVKEPSGTTLMDFELNQSDVPCGPGGVTRQRTPGDLLIEYRIEQGGSQATLLVRTWTAGGAWGSAMDLTTAAEAVGTINETAIPAGESDGLGPSAARTFGEASLDLDFLFDEEECTSFGSAFLKSRSSDSFSSQLKDFIAPKPVNISNCGSIEITKQTDPDGAPGSFGFTASTGLSPATFSLGDGQTRTFTNVLAGDYAIAENSNAPGTLDSIVCTVPAGGSSTWAVDTTNDHEVDISLAADETVRCTFTNSVVGSILVEKVATGGAPLTGATFSASPNAGDPPAPTPSTDDDVAIPATSTDGYHCVDGVPFGSYTVTETQAPDGYNPGPAQTVTVASIETCTEKLDADPIVPDLTFTNSPAPGRVNVSKADDDGDPMDGVTFQLTLEDSDPAVSYTCVTGTRNGGPGATSPPPAPAAGTCSFIDVPIGTYSLDEVDLPSGYSKDTDLPETITIGLGSTPGTGQTISKSYTNTQTHKVIVLVCHEGTSTLAASAATDGKTTLSSSQLGDADLEAAICGMTTGAVYTGLDHTQQDYEVTPGGHQP